MPTLRCAACGATYYTAATDQLLELVLVMFDCEICDAADPLYVTDGGVGYLAPAGVDSVSKRV
jgi:hypothetical protein